MALVTKMVRCALCGSSDVRYDKGRYDCAACGARSEHPMSAADIANINRIVALGGSGEELAALRRRYPRLHLTSWSSESRLQVK